MQDETAPLLPHRQSCWSVYRLSSLLRTQPLEQATNNNKGGNPDASLKKCLTVVDLIAYGIASTIGAGIFVASGQASVIAGPSVILSFFLAGLASLLSALCYAEFAARIPVSGSAYSFSYIALGEIIGWLIGWCLTLEYSISASAVARVWAATVVQFLTDLGVPVPYWVDNWALFGQVPSSLDITDCTIAETAMDYSFLRDIPF
jgi:amino acid transporter